MTKQYRNVNGKRVPMTAKEVAAFNASRVVPIGEDAVRAECQKRLITAFTARDAEHLERLINEATMEAVDLLSRQAEWTEYDQTRVAELKAGRILVAAHDAASKALRAMDPIPADFADDKHWP